MNCLLVPVLVKRSFSARETLSLLWKRGWRGAQGKGSCSPTYTLLAPVILEIRSSCAVAQKGTWSEPSTDTAPFPSPPSHTVAVRELPVPWPTAHSSELCLSLLMDTQDQGRLLFPTFLKPHMFNYRLSGNINPSIPKEDYSSWKSIGTNQDGKNPASPSQPFRRSQTRACVHILTFHTFSEIKAHTLILITHSQPARNSHSCIHTSSR